MLSLLIYVLGLVTPTFWSTLLSAGKRRHFKKMISEVIYDFKNPCII